MARAHSIYMVYGSCFMTGNVAIRRVHDGAEVWVADDKASKVCCSR